ncbi:MAG: HPt (histidine-containing phosphotransfer) domain-containing protein [Myxococcota bacterium]|jgi:HPt (histidine-containing phosphotransfer) domain-containing protein
MSIVFDRERLVEQLGGQSIVEELLVMFAASIRLHLTQLDDAVRAHDIQAAQRAVHNIKGISGSIYCHTLHTHASVVDKALKFGKVDLEEITRLRESAQEFLGTIDSDG